MRETDLTGHRQQRCDRGHEKMFLKQTVRSAFVQMVCDAMASLRCTIFELRMTARGQNEKRPFSTLCQLPPAADIALECAPDGGRHAKLSPGPSSVGVGALPLLSQLSAPQSILEGYTVSGLSRSVMEPAG
jgi:hypothetical protein